MMQHSSVPPGGTADAAGDIRITGSGTAAGGHYRRVRVVGEGTFDGPVRCEELRVTGALRVRGSLTADRLHINGDVTVQDSLQAHYAFIRGLITVHGNLEAERLDVRGAASVEGLMSADQLSLRLHGPARAREIGGSRIDVRDGWRWSRRPGATLTADVIEGDDVSVEKVRARLVRGTTVRIGPDSRIDRVEYDAHADVSAQAQVGEVVKR
ncbi:MAG: polymer-forming cytoskeletal protein [Alicyclobacillaceae bacterium]|nr:polymer-forming cytoskeletal protein [Alicyclobacillaceae bacterium]